MTLHEIQTALRGNDEDHDAAVEYLGRAATDRVRFLFGVGAIADYCLGDWPEGTDHLVWLLTDSRQAILDWHSDGQW